MQFITTMRRPRLAEGRGFEPPSPFGDPVFETGAISLSATLPYLADGARFERALRFRKFAFQASAFSLSANRP